VRWGAGVVLLLLLASPLPAQIAALHDRNREEANHVAHVRQMVASSPENAVFLSYLMNDHLAYYGHRSVLNYRRIAPADPVAGRYQFERYEPCLAITIDRLLNAGIPVYYIAESPVSAWNPEKILRTHFRLQVTGTSPIVYQIHRTALLERTLSCPRQ
jgi:hypothetical protein